MSCPADSSDDDDDDNHNNSGNDRYQYDPPGITPAGVKREDCGQGCFVVRNYLLSAHFSASLRRFGIDDNARKVNFAVRSIGEDDEVL